MTDVQAPSQPDVMPICGDDYPLTEKQQKLMALARQLGREKFAPRAAQLDRDAQFPFANYDDMHASGLLALCVPEAHGGHGADYATYAMVSAEIGRYCGATALTFNMHVCTMLWSGLLSEDLEMTPEQRTIHRGDSRKNSRALAVVARVFAAEASQWPLAQWPQQYWRLLLATPGIDIAVVPDTVFDLPMVWSTGASVRRRDPWTGRVYDEVLSLDATHVDLSRLNGGAPLLNTHGAYDLEDVLGVVEAAWIDTRAGTPVDFASVE